MSIPVSTALGRHDRLWPTVLVSAALHAALVTWAVVRRPAPDIDLDQKPIVARLVRLGQKRPDEYLPRKEAGPPPAAPPAPAAVPVAAAPPKPAAPATKAAPKPAPPSAGAPSSTGKSGTTLASVLSKVQRQDEQWGSPEGDPEGDSETGSEGDRYYALIVRELKANYGLPKTLSPSDLANLRATVILLIDEAGRVTGHAFERRSGNPAYDAALERAIQKARLPPPPAALRERFRTVGLGVNFHL